MIPLKPKKIKKIKEEKRKQKTEFKVERNDTLEELQKLGKT